MSPPPLGQPTRSLVSTVHQEVDTPLREFCVQLLMKSDRLVNQWRHSGHSFLPIIGWLNSVLGGKTPQNQVKKGFRRGMKAGF